MASDSKDGKSSLEQVKSGSLEELDLEKNPIKYAKDRLGNLALDAHDKDYMELTLKTGKHSELVQKLLRQRIELRAKEFPRWPGDHASGVRAIWIESRFWYDRERLLPDFDQDWRMYRAKYLDSLELDPREPVHVPEYEKSLINPIRRFYMKGGDWLEDNVIRKFTSDKLKSAMYRVVFTRGIMLWMFGISAYYYIRYNNQTWMERGGPMLFVTAPKVYADHPNFPFKDFRTEPAHHWNLGFTRRTIFKDLRNWEDTTTVL